MTDAPPTPAELIDLERRIARRGLQFQRVRGEKLPGVRSSIPAQKAVRVNERDEALIRTALLEQAMRLKADD